MGKETITFAAETAELEHIKSLENVSIEVRTDLSDLLAQVNAKLGTTMTSRASGYHLTVIGLAEKAALQQLTPDQLQRLHDIHQAIQAGHGVTVTGLGYIDGAQNRSGRSADKTKKVAFIALEIPALQAFRQEVGLPAKDFHITLGFEEGDIHYQITTQNEQGQNILELIPKKANPELADLTLPKLDWGLLAGQTTTPKTTTL